MSQQPKPNSSSSSNSFLPSRMHHFLYHSLPRSLYNALDYVEETWNRLEHNLPAQSALGATGTAGIAAYGTGSAEAFIEFLGEQLNLHPYILDGLRRGGYALSLLMTATAVAGYARHMQRRSMIEHEAKSSHANLQRLHQQQAQLTALEGEIASLRLEAKIPSHRLAATAEQRPSPSPSATILDIAEPTAALAPPNPRTGYLLFGLGSMGMGALILLLPVFATNPALAPLLNTNLLAFLGIPASHMAGQGLAVALPSSKARSSHQQSMLVLHQARVQSDEDFQRKKPLLTAQQSRLKDELKSSQSTPELSGLAQNPYLLSAIRTTPRREDKRESKARDVHRETEQGYSSEEDITSVTLPSSSSQPNFSSR